MEVSALAPTRARRQTVHLTTNATWTKEEDDLLTQIASSQENIAWSVVAKLFPNKTAPQLAGRWEKVLDPHLIKGSWTREEDEIIIDFVSKNGDKDWAKLALLLKGRTGKQCRERFKNHLDPNVAKNSWTEEEDNKLIELHAKFGNSWTKISHYFEGRTDNCIKNRWNSTLKKRLERKEKGEPLIMKRGRKPKSVKMNMPKPDLSDSLSSTGSVCSSPLRPFDGKRSIIDLVPLTENLSIIQARYENNKSPKPMASLEENRKGLFELIGVAAK